MNILFTLTKLANHFDKLGLYNEADQIDLIIQQAVDMSPEEYEKYYGKPKYDGSTIKEELDVKTPEGYKKYYGKDPLETEPMPESQQFKPIHQSSYYHVGDEVVVKRIPEKYQGRSQHPAVGEILEVFKVNPDHILAGQHPRMPYEFAFDEVSLYQKVDPFKEKYPDDETHYIQQALVEVIGAVAEVFDIARKHNASLQRLQLSYGQPNVGSYWAVFPDTQSHDAFVEEVGNYTEDGWDETTTPPELVADFGENVYLQLVKFKPKIVYINVGLGNNEPLAREAYYRKI